MRVASGGGAGAHLQDADDHREEVDLRRVGTQHARGSNPGRAASCQLLVDEAAGVHGEKKMQTDASEEGRGD